MELLFNSGIVERDPQGREIVVKANKSSVSVISVGKKIIP
jgi:hypothetical protein